MALEQDQKDWIEKKVCELGSKEAVHRFYQKDDAVCQYALKLADKIYGR